MHEVRTPSRTVFTQEQNTLLVQQVLQYSQLAEGDELHYHVLGLDESSIEDDMKKAYCTLDRQFHPDKNKRFQFSFVMKMINEAKEELENTLHHNDALREQERVCMAKNTIEILSYSSSSLSSDDSLETLSDDSSDSGKSQIPTKPVTSSNK